MMWKVIYSRWALEGRREESHIEENGYFIKDPRAVVSWSEVSPSINLLINFVIRR